MDNRVLHLTNLSALSVEDSQILSVPSALGCMYMTRLCRESNLTTDWPIALRDSALISGSSYLNLFEKRGAWLLEDLGNEEEIESLRITGNCCNIMSTLIREETSLLVSLVHLGKRLGAWEYSSKE